jgi:hypothetical protein
VRLGAGRFAPIWFWQRVTVADNQKQSFQKFTGLGLFAEMARQDRLRAEKT